MENEEKIYDSKEKWRKVSPKRMKEMVKKGLLNENPDSLFIDKMVSNWASYDHLEVSNKGNISFYDDAKSEPHPDLGSYKRTINCGKSLIQYETQKALLIKFPYSKWCFWIPKACVDVHENSLDILIRSQHDYYTTKMKTHIKDTMPGEEIISGFKGEELIADLNIFSYKRHKPKKIKTPKERKINDELIR